MAFSNYAPTILLGRCATEMGCQQVLWLYDNDEKLTEVGTMNIFIYWINENGGGYELKEDVFIFFVVIFVLLTQRGGRNNFKTYLFW